MIQGVTRSVWVHVLALGWLGFSFATACGGRDESSQSTQPDGSAGDAGSSSGSSAAGSSSGGSVDVANSTAGGGAESTSAGQPGAGGIGTGTASTGGAADAGASGALGSGAAGGEPDSSVKPSMGCMKPANQALDQWVRYTVAVQTIEREYFVRLPPTYDPAKPYRLMFTFPGCGGKGDSALPLFNAPGADAIVVGPSPDGLCWVYTADSKDVAFFDEMLTLLEANFCVDQQRIFASGFSSGAWFTNVLGCQRSNVLRAQGTISGEWPRVDPTICSPQSIAGILIQDHSERDFPSRRMELDRLLTLNGCSAETRPVLPEPCVEYVGCKSGYPVVWCQTQGQGHSRQDALSVPALYNFFAQF